MKLVACDADGNVTEVYDLQLQDFVNEYSVALENRILDELADAQRRDLVEQSFAE